MLAVLLLATLLVSSCIGDASSLRASTPTTTTTLGPLQRVVFAHRHGARTPILNVNGSCDVLGCGTLTPAGKRMLRSLGMSFRSHYGALLPAQYDTKHFVSVSDTSNRVIQSADAFLYGLFNSSEVYPVIDTTAADVINPSSQPGRSLHSITTYPAVLLTIMPIIESQIINKSVIEAIGREMGMWDVECSLLPPACLAEAIDFVAYAISEGEINRFPTAKKFLPQLAQARLMLFKWIFGAYDENIANNTYNRDAGWEGVNLAQAMLGTAAKGALLTEFSGHDTTLMPLFASLGNLTYAYPDFGTAFILEVYGSADGSGDLNVVAKIASIGQEPALQNTVTFTSYQLTCMSSSGTQYPSDPVVGCPLADLNAFVATRTGVDASTVSPSNCYAWPSDSQFIQCDPVKNSGSVKADSPCGKYRSACPFVACGAGRYMTPTLGCNSAV